MRLHRIVNRRDAQGKVQRVNGCHLWSHSFCHLSAPLYVHQSGCSLNPAVHGFLMKISLHWWLIINSIFSPSPFPESWEIQLEVLNFSSKLHLLGHQPSFWSYLGDKSYFIRTRATSITLFRMFQRFQGCVPRTRDKDHTYFYNARSL